MAGLSAKTEKIRIGTLVMCNSYRNPALLAKTLSTIDHISNGRLEIATARAGWTKSTRRTLPVPSMGTRLKMFEKACTHEADVHREARVVRGRHYQIKEAICNPKPVQQPHPPITIGAAARRSC